MMIIIICFNFPAGEARGVGGIFFDDLDTPNQEEAFKFVTVSRFYKPQVAIFVEVVMFFCGPRAC